MIVNLPAEVVATATDEVVGATEEAVAAKTEEQADEAAARTDKASVAPQELKTQLVAADWMAASLAAEHWQSKSDSEHFVALVTALAMQVVAQDGI